MHLPQFRRSRLDAASVADESTESAGPSKNISPGPVLGGEMKVLEAARTELGKRAFEFLQQFQIRGLSNNTIEAYFYDLLYFRRWLEAKSIRFKEIDDRQLLAFIQHQREENAAPKTINRRLGTVRQFYRFAFHREVPRSPGVGSYVRRRLVPQRDFVMGLHRIRGREEPSLRVKEPHKLVDPLQTPEAQAFIKSLRRYRDMAIALLMLFCGLRSAEVRTLRLRDLDLLERVIRVHGKGNRERVLPLPPSVCRALIKYIRLERGDLNSEYLFVVLQGAYRGRQLTPQRLKQLFRYRRLVSGIEKANPHRLRHTFGTDMARAGVKLPVLKRIMGHQQGSTTLQYINLSMADIADEVQNAMAKIRARYAEFEEEIT
jgi:site-specific recombinase XerD